MKDPRLPSAPRPRAGQRRAAWRAPASASLAALALAETARHHDGLVLAAVAEHLTRLADGAPLPQRIALHGGPYGGSHAMVRYAPARIEVSGKYTYVRVDDPETGESLNFYSYDGEQSHE